MRSGDPTGLHRGRPDVTGPGGAPWPARAASLGSGRARDLAGRNVLGAVDGPCLPVSGERLLGRSAEARAARRPRGLSLSAFRAAGPCPRAGVIGDGPGRARAGDEVVAVVTQPVRDLDVARFAAEDDPGRSDAAAVMLLEDAHPQMAVEEDGENGGSRRHRVSRYAESGPDDAGFLARGEATGTVGAARTSHRAVRFAHQELMRRAYSTGGVLAVRFAPSRRARRSRTPGRS